MSRPLDEESFEDLLDAALRGESPVGPADPGEAGDPARRRQLALVARVQELAEGRTDALFLQSVVENLPDMVFVKDATELRFVRFNAAGEALLGIPRAAMIGKNDFDFFPPDEARFFVEKDREVLSGGSIVDIPEEPIHTAHGLRLLHTRKIPIVDEDGHPLYLLGISRDVTEARRQADELRRREGDLRASAARVRLLLTHLPGVLWTTDGELRLTSVEGARVAALGLEAAEGRRVEELLPSSDPSLDARAAHERALAGERVTWEFSVGAVDYEARLERLDPAEGVGVLGVAIDVTERRAAEAERLEERLRRTQRLEVLGLLAGGIAHDFNNLLTSVLGNASRALGRLAPGDEPRVAVERVIASAEAAADLTRQLLAYSGKGRFVIEPVDLSRLVEDISALLRVSLAKGATLRLDLGRDLPPVDVDVAQIRQIVLNLITNASDALVGGTGTITVVTTAVDVDRAYLSQAWLDDDLPAGRYVCLEVTDTGCGMDADTQARIFDPFFTTKPRGHGLGLAATLGIVRGHHGAIRVYSEPGVGTTIKVLLPASQAEARARPAAAAELSPREPVRGRGLVMVVDDDDGIRLLAGDILRDAGFHVLPAEDGAAAVEVFRELGEQVDVVLLDMTMPRMGGEETFRELTRLRPDVQVLLSSGYNEQEATNRFAGTGLAGFIQKPYRADDLLARVMALVRR